MFPHSRALRLFSLFLVLSVFSVAGRTARAQQNRCEDVLCEINEMHELGRISDDQRLIYRVAALRDPGRLPEELRSLPVRGVGPVDSGTMVMVEAFQSLDKVPPATAEELKPMLMPPDPMAYYLEQASPYPLRVYYDVPSHEAKAQAVMDAATHTYQREVVDWGFWEPAIDPAFGHYIVYIGDAGGAGAYNAPYDFNDATPQTDAFSYIVMDQGNSLNEIPVIFAHEYNHACQGTFDVLERLVFWEATATYIMSQVYPESWYYTEYFLESFQSYPFLAIDWQEQGGANAGYIYGEALWVIFLEHIYGGDDPSWIAGLWEDCVQNVWINEPDYLDAVSDAVADDGFAESFAMFARYRYFVGHDDDGAHLPNAGDWKGSEVAVERSWSWNQLPVNDEGPSSSSRPQPNGCNYIEVNVGGSMPSTVTVDFEGQDDMLWNVDLMVVADGQDTLLDTLALEDDSRGSGTVSTAPGDRVVMVVCHLADHTYDPDDEDWQGGDYSYSLTSTEEKSPAEIDSAYPQTLAQGEQGVEVTVAGKNFAGGEELAALVSGAGVTVSGVTLESGFIITFTVDVAKDAQPGPRDITLVLAGGEEVTGAGLLVVVEGDIEETSISGDEDGCGCSVQGASRVRMTGLLSLLFDLF